MGSRGRVPPSLFFSYRHIRLHVLREFFAIAAIRYRLSRPQSVHLYRVPSSLSLSPSIRDQCAAETEARQLQGPLPPGQVTRCAPHDVQGYEKQGGPGLALLHTAWQRRRHVRAWRHFVSARGTLPGQGRVFACNSPISVSFPLEKNTFQEPGTQYAKTGIKYQF